MLGGVNPMARRVAAHGFAVFACAWLLTNCGDDTGAVEPRDSAIADKLTRALQFQPSSTLINGPLPTTTEPRATLLPLGPQVVVEPMASAIMAFEVQDPEQRPVMATLIQFEDAESYVRVPPQEGEGANIVIENPLIASDDLCEGLCDAIFTVTVSEAVEFADGTVSAVSTRQIVVDCREAGDREACDKDLGGAEVIEGLPCGDVTMAVSALSGDRALDSHLEAVRVFAASMSALDKSVDGVRGELAKALGIPETSDAETVSEALTAAIEANTEDGLALLLGERGCGLRRKQVLHALSSCDPEGAMGDLRLQCEGLCQPRGDSAVCDAAEARGCRGLVEDSACGDTCTGACRTELEEPTACEGTCMGTCDGECPGGGDACAGPCDGLCTGQCRSLSEGPCEGECTGLCDEPTAGLPACGSPLEPYCSAPADAPLACPGDCFGSAALADGAELCRTSALAIGHALPRCEATLAQLSFTFQGDVEPGDQAAFASLVEKLSTPIGRLLEMLRRTDLLLTSETALTASGAGEITTYLAAEIAASPDDSGLQCAQEQLTGANEWLAEQPERIQMLRDQSMVLLTGIVPEQDPQMP